MVEQRSKPVNARKWLDGGPFPGPELGRLEDGAPVVACFFLGALDLLRTKQDNPYLRLQLMDRTGTVEGRVWDEAQRVADLVQVGDFVGVRGRVQVFRGERQLKVEAIQAVEVDASDLQHFLPRSTRDAEEMEQELQALLAAVSDPHLADLLERILAPDTETGRLFRIAPAAKLKHHACVGGLLEHTLSVAGICRSLATHYGSGVDADLLTAGALLHDIGKIREIGVAAGFPYTDEGRLLGHILIGLKIVTDAAADVADLETERVRLLLHLIASHQGRHEWQSPCEPSIIEALILHYADDLDAKVQQVGQLLETAPGPGEWTAYDRSFGRAFFRHRVETLVASGEVSGAEPAPVTSGEPAAGPAATRRSRKSKRAGESSAARQHTTGPGAGQEPDSGSAILDLFDEGPSGEPR